MTLVSTLVPTQAKIALAALASLSLSACVYAHDGPGYGDGYREGYQRPYSDRYDYDRDYGEYGDGYVRQYRRSCYGDDCGRRYGYGGEYYQSRSYRVCDSDGDRCYHSRQPYWDYRTYYRKHGYRWLGD